MKHQQSNHSGFITKLCSIFVIVSAFLFPVHGEITKKILFVDDDYYSQYAGDIGVAERYFLAQGFPIIQALFDFTFESAFNGMIKFLPAQ